MSFETLIFLVIALIALSRREKGPSARPRPLHKTTRHQSSWSYMDEDNTYRLPVFSEEFIYDQSYSTSNSFSVFGDSSSTDINSNFSDSSSIPGSGIPDNNNGF